MNPRLFHTPMLVLGFVLFSSSLQAESNPLGEDWVKIKTKMSDGGYTLKTELIVDYMKTLEGGLNTSGDSLLNEFTISLDVDTAEAWQIENGGRFYLEFQNQAGQDIQSDDVGAAHNSSNINNGGYTAITEAFYDWTTVTAPNLRLKFGKMDASDDFARPENGQNFLNQAAQTSSNIFGMPENGITSTGLSFFYQLDEWTELSSGVFDGSAAVEGVNTGSRGPSTFFGDPSDLFAIGQMTMRWKRPGDLADAPAVPLPGKLAIGGWGHTGTFNSTGGGTRSGASGFFAVLDQAIIHNQCWFFVQYSLVIPGDVDDLNLPTEVREHTAIGFRTMGLCPARPQDESGVMFSYFRLQDGTTFIDEDHETLLEFYHRFAVTPNISIQPVFQMITNPSSTAGASDAIVGAIRSTFTF